MTRSFHFNSTLVKYLCLLWLICRIIITHTATTAETGRCEGKYCGRLNDTEECGRCPRGYRTDGLYCLQCLGKPELYDWLYLGFMALVTTLMHWAFIYQHGRRKLFIVILQFSALLESILAGIFTLLATEPKGSLSLRTCGVEQLSDWYTVFFNPKPDHVNKIHCTQEAVYPLYSMVLYYYAFSVLLLLLVRPVLSVKMCEGQGRMSIYAALYFLPMTAMVHATCAGLIYYTFPYLLLIGSVLSIAILLAKKNITNISEVMEKKDVIVILIGHWVLHAFALIALTEWRDPKTHGSLFALVVLPSLFYLLTVKLSDPRKFK